MPGRVGRGGAIAGAGGGVDSRRRRRDEVEDDCASNLSMAVSADHLHALRPVSVSNIFVIMVSNPASFVVMSSMAAVTCDSNLVGLRDGARAVWKKFLGGICGWLGGIEGSGYQMLESEVGGEGDSGGIWLELGEEQEEQGGVGDRMFSLIHSCLCRFTLVGYLCNSQSQAGW